jgi:simple sugar transport system ATP-binding protein
MYRGRILAIVEPDRPREELGLLMAGVAAGEGRTPDPSRGGREPGPSQEEGTA